MKSKVTEALDNNYNTVANGIKAGVRQSILLYDLDNTLDTIRAMLMTNAIDMDQYDTYRQKFMELRDQIGVSENR